MLRSLAISVAFLAFALLAFPPAAPAENISHFVIVKNSSGNEMLVTLDVLLPPYYQDAWAMPGRETMFMPGSMAWKGVLYISVRASTGSSIDKNSPHICLSSMPILGNEGRRYTAHYNGHACWISRD
jgi:hypothetical protein